MKYQFLLFILFVFLGACNQEPQVSGATETKQESDIFVMVLGTAQDAGYPQAGCKKTCCEGYWNGKEPQRLVSCLGLVDRTTGQSWLFDATPNIRIQLMHLHQASGNSNPEPDGVFLTHAHIGHYTGLMHFGREAMGANGVPTYAMPRMKGYLEENGPWELAIELGHVKLQALQADSAIQVNKNLKVTPFLVPHRDEYSETVGYQIESQNKKVIFIPDIDKWSKWDRDILDLIRAVDVAFLDGSFYQNGELPNRDMSEIPHPFIEESIALFEDLAEQEKAKIQFIHFNHTNPVLRDTPERATVEAAGFGVAEAGQRVAL